MNEHDFEKERLEALEQEIIEKEQLEKDRIEQQKRENKLFPNNSLFMIPSWSDLLGYPLLGTYVHHPVSKIESDVVIFFSSYDYSIETARGTLHYLFGLGYYFLKFELESGKYITDNRILTGLILSDFVYDHMATSTSITLQEDRDVIIAEKVIKIPIDMSYKSENHKTFIKGALMRNVFIPNKDIFLEMMDTIGKEDSYQISNQGHKILSSHWDFYNIILVSEKMRAITDPSYLNLTAGLNGIDYAADKLLLDTISPINLNIIEDNIKNLKAIYSNLEFDPMYLFSILEQVYITIGPTIISPSSKQSKESSNGQVKESIFYSAEERLSEFKKWPLEFKRKAKKEPIALPKTLQQPSYEELIESTTPSTTIIDTREQEQENFVINTLKSEKVEYKPLPTPPKADINKILLYLKEIINDNYEMSTIGQAFEIARESIKQLGVIASTEHQKKAWEMSKYANIYKKKKAGYGLHSKEKSELIRKIDAWLFEIEENARIERERLETARLEEERLIRLEQEKKEREMLERERREAERLERNRIEKEKRKQEEIRRAERAKIEKEKQKQIRLEQERLENERKELEAFEREKLELERLKQERKQKEKQTKNEAKKRKKLEKERKKIEKKKLKEQERLEKL